MSEDPKTSEIVEATRAQVPGVPAFDWRQVLEFSPDMIIVVDRRGTILYINRTIAGLDFEQVVGTSALEFVPVDDREQMRDHIRHVFESGTPISYEVSGIGPGDSVSWYFSSMSPVVADGEVVAATIITRDITARRQLEQSVIDAYEQEREAADRLRELDDLKNEFVAKVVHDLRTPITVVDGFAQTLLDGWDSFSDARRLEFVELMHASSGRLRELVRDVLDVARLESAEFSIELAPFDIRDSLEHVVASMAALDRSIEWQVDDDVPLVLADAVRHQQILVNLVANAVKFSPTESAVRIAVRYDAPDIEVSVIDVGIGIAETEFPRLFDRFVQLPRSDRSTPEGSGLGLFICRTLVEAQGGSIHVESTPGVGSTFVYRLPAAG
jgi:PAS domain S-box-containing protein